MIPPSATYTVDPDGVLVRAGAPGLDYSDGDATEARIAGLVAAARDRSVASPELWAAIDDWPSEYHLSMQRANLLRPLRDLRGLRVLELGAGMGAVTRFLGEAGAQVTAVEGSRRRAAIARARTSDLAGVTVLCDDIMRFAGAEGTFDVVLLIGVLEYAARYIPGPDPAATLLAKAGSLAKAGGCVLVAIENALGIKYLAGAAEDHTGVPYQSVEDRYPGGGVRTFGLGSLLAKLAAAGLRRQRTLIAHPDYKLPAQIIDHAAIDPAIVPAARLMRNAAARDGAAPVRRAFSEALALRHFEANGLLLPVANSFLVLASREGDPAAWLRDGEFAWLFSQGRRPEFQTKTALRRHPSGQLEAAKEMLTTAVRSEPQIRWIAPPPALLRVGPLLSERMVDGFFARPEGDWENLRAIFAAYATFLTSAADARGLIAGNLLDALPRNVVCGDDGWHLIDYEWESVAPLELDFVLYRAARSVLDEVSTYPASATLRTGFADRAAAVLSLMSACGRTFTRARLLQLVERDALLVHQVAARPAQSIASLVESAALAGPAGYSDQRTREVERLGAADQRIAELTGRLASATDLAAGLAGRVGEALAGLQAAGQQLATAELKVIDLTDRAEEAAALIAQYEGAATRADAALAVSHRTLADLNLEIARQGEALAALRGERERATTQAQREREQISHCTGIPAPEVDAVVVVAGLVSDLEIMTGARCRAEEEAARLRKTAAARVTEAYHLLHQLLAALPDPGPDHQVVATRRRLAELSALNLDEAGFDLEGHLGFVSHALYGAIDAARSQALGSEDLLRRIEERERIIALQQESLSTLPVRIARRLARVLPRIAPPGTWRRRALNWLATRIDGRPRNASPPVPASQPAPITGSAAPLPDPVPVEPVTSDGWSPVVRSHEPGLARLIAAGVPAAPPRAGPLISVILPVYRIPVRVFARTIGCLIGQTYPNWEACIAFADSDGKDKLDLLERWSVQDPRLRVTVLPANLGISGNSNAALAMAQGEWLALLDHDDELPVDAFARLVAQALAQPAFDLWYTDKDCMDEASQHRLTPLLKPSWSPEMMYSVNYLTHLNLLRTEVVRRIGGWRAETDGAQDWDLFLRVAAAGRGVGRALGIAYHWRIIAGSTSTGVGAKPYVVAAQLRTIEDHVRRLGHQARVQLDTDSGFRIRWQLPAGARVLIAALLPGSTGTAATLAEGMARNLRTACTALRAEHVTCTGAGAAAIPAWSTRHQDPAGPVAALLTAAATSQAEWVVLAGDGLLEATPEWADELVGWLGHDAGIAFAAPLILDPSGTVVEAGRVTDHRQRGHPLFRGSVLRTWGVFGGPLWHRNVRAASAWGLAVRRRELLDCAARLPAERDVHAWAVRLCLELTRDGRRGVVVPPVRLTVAKEAVPAAPEFDASLADDPFFHPDLRSATRPALIP